jgi:hypothetical protein
MSSAKSVVELACFKVLSEAVTGATVYQDAPHDAPLPVVILGDMKSFRLDTKGATADRRVQISIVSLVEAEERAPLLGIMEQIDAALDGQTVTTDDGWTLGFTFDEDDAVLSEDGTTYTGVTSFSVTALES